MAPTVEEIAQVCHEANRAVQNIQLDPAPSKVWHAASPEERASAIVGVEKALKGRTPEELHQAWCDYKLDDGWTYGPLKNVAAKTHPCLVAYDELPAHQKLKDELFTSIVRALSA